MLKWYALVVCEIALVTELHALHTAALNLAVFA